MIGLPFFYANLIANCKKNVGRSTRENIFTLCGWKQTFAFVFYLFGQTYYKKL